MHGVDGLACTGKQQRARYTEHDVVGAVPSGELRDACVVHPVRELHLERGTEAPDDGVDVDLDAGLGDQRREARADAGPGVDERHVEIEADDERVGRRAVGHGITILSEAACTVWP